VRAIDVFGIATGRGELRSTIDPLPAILAGHGCEGLYVPFPASVSVHAASLGAEMTLDWVNGVYSPALRTRLIDSAQQLATPDCDPLRDRECPYAVHEFLGGRRQQNAAAFLEVYAGDLLPAVQARDSDAKLAGCSRFGPWNSHAH